MMRHLSDDSLASYIEGDLRPRRAAKVGSHLAGCSNCQDRAAALEAVPSLLASAQFPPIPDRLSSRIEMALSAESSARVASEPASEAGRRDLPTRAGPVRPGRPGRHGRERSWVTSPLALRTAAGVGAAVVLAAGGYAIVSHSGSGPSSSSESISGPAAAPATRSGLKVNYEHAGHTHSIKAVTSATNFKAASLSKQAELALASQRSIVSQGAAHASGSMSTLGGSTSTPLPGASVIPSMAKLQGCVTRIAAGRTVLLVEIAKYQGSPATIIVASSAPSARAEVYAVGVGCSTGASDILAHQSMPRP